MTIIGLIPAGGRATRMYGLPKYNLPTPDGTLMDVLRRRMVKAGIADIRTIFEEGATVCDALLKVGTHESAVFAMPDTYWHDEIAIEKLLVTLNRGAEIAVGIWKIRPDQRGKLGQCAIHGNGLMGVIDKDPDCPLEWAWGVIAWRPLYFWSFIHPDDTHLGLALNRAIKARVDVQAVKMTGNYWDCGTPDEYFRLCSTWTQEAVAHGG